MADALDPRAAYNELAAELDCYGCTCGPEYTERSLVAPDCWPHQLPLAEAAAAIRALAAALTDAREERELWRRAQIREEEARKAAEARLRDLEAAAGQALCFVREAWERDGAVPSCPRARTIQDLTRLLSGEPGRAAPDDDPWEAKFLPHCAKSAPTAPKAICLAALAAVGGRDGGCS